MKLEDITLLYQYNYWANKLILDTAKNVSAEDLYKPNSYSWGSLAGTLLHNVDAEYGWRVLLTDRAFIDELKIEDYPELDSIIAVYEKEEALMWDYINSLADEDLAGIIHYSGEGFSRSRVLWHCLVHVVNHGTQHRSECAVMLTDLGHSPGEIDLTVYLNTLV